ncbi:integration host factor subunit beta [Thiohalocapsa marina]|uniref:Integration host factor subunit beta n=1 Tax=Thiohalocapsa marina TaxID=424902 RepID=A0A5M8FD59_9GAMM|nr:integration host factor subunit beta [Thiohalocapsa marina]
MTRTDLIKRLAAQQPHLSVEDMAQAVQTLIGQITVALVRGERIEIRDFGAFSLRHYAARMGLNPRTGEPVAIPARRAVYFRPGKALRERVAGGWAPDAGALANDALTT